MQRILNDITTLGENELEQLQNVIKKALKNIRSNTNCKKFESAKNILKNDWFKNMCEYTNLGNDIEDVFCEKYWMLPLSVRWCEIRVSVPDFDKRPPCNNEDCWWKRDTDKTGYDRKYFKLVIDENVGFCSKCYKKYDDDDCLDVSAEESESLALSSKVDEWVTEFLQTK